MTAEYPVDEVPATPEYMFELSRGFCGQHTQTYEAVADSPASGYFCEHTWMLEFAIEEAFGMIVDDIDLAKLEPLSKHTVREVCELLAALVRRPMIRPWKHIAGECMPAGAFLTIRSMLVQAGANPERITPSTRLRRYRTWYGTTLLTAIRRLAPERYPGRNEPMPWGTFLCVTLPGALLILLVLLGKAGVEIPIGLLLGEIFGGFAVCVFGMVRLHRWEYRKDLGDLVTFRDLAYALAGQEPRRRIQPTA